MMRPREHRNVRFVRRAGCVFAVFLVLSAIGLSTVIAFALGGQHTRSNVVFAIAGALLVVIAFVFVASVRSVGLPMGSIVSAAERVGGGDYSVRVTERGPPFLRIVARAFNRMTASLDSAEQQRRNFMADIAHELRTPLAVVQGRIEGLIDGVYPRDDARLQELLDDTHLLARLIEDFRTLANAENGALTLKKEATDIDVLIEETISSFAQEAKTRGVTLRATDSDELPLIEVDSLRIREVLMNLIANALRHTSDGGSVDVAARATQSSVSVTVKDTGAGISEADLPHVFERFYKGRDSKGSGLGLAIAKNLVELHGGELRAVSEAGVGTSMTFVLPR
jgi:two-component system sensor histidine kinase BaeS